MASTAGPTAIRRLASEVDVLQEGEAAIESFAVDGALTKNTGAKLLTKGSAGAYTLAAPTADEAGARIAIVAGSAFAHVITATNLIDDGVTGGAKDTITMGAFVGASIVLIAINLKWTVESKNVATVAAV